MGNLLRTEAAERAQLICVHTVNVDLDLRSLDDFISVTTIDFSAQPGAATFVDFAGRELTGALLNGRDLSPRDWADGRIQLTGLAATNQLVVSGVMEYGTSGEGLHLHVDPADGHPYLYAMSFLDAAPRWFACFDQPDLKATYQFAVVAPPDWTVLGNAVATKDDRGKWHIGPTKPLSTYFVTLAAGPWVSIVDSHDGIDLALYARRSLADALATESADILEVTRAAMDHYHRLFRQRYPFGAYQQVFVPDFNAGAMENPGCVVFRDQYLYRGASTRTERAKRASTIAHEMAHQWFGDLVTMRWWDDLWLNESFAEYLGHRVCTQATDYRLWVEFGINRKDWGSVADQGPSTHPVALNGAEDAESALANFDGISYAKGASALRQFAARVGDDVFLGGLNDYFDAHRFGNATLADLTSAWRRAGAEGLPDWTAQWLGTSGQDLLLGDRDDRGWLVRRLPPEHSTATRTHAIEAALIAPDGTELAREPLLVTEAETRVNFADGAEVEGALLLPDAGDASWARVRASSGFLLPRIDRIADPASRVVCYNAIRDGVRNGDLAPRSAFDQLAAALPGEPHDELLRAMLAFAGQLTGLWSARGHRPGLRAELANVAHQILDAAPAGSDRQLIAMRSLATCSDDPVRLSGWLDDDRLPAGRQPDQDLRWSLVNRLMILGADPRLIDAELRRDPSAAGQDAAAGARAAIGTMAAKQATLAAIVQPSARRAYEVYAIAGQLFLPEQDELCEQLVEPFFEGIPATASFRSGWALATVTSAAFPLTIATQRTAQLAADALGRQDLHPQVRRALTDANHLLNQAIRAATVQPMGRS